MSDEELNYDCSADLHEMGQADPAGFVRGGATYRGTLAGAVKQFMALPQASKASASILLDPQSALRSKGLLDPGDIEAIYLRPDFPK